MVGDLDDYLYTNFHFQGIFDELAISKIEMAYIEVYQEQAYDLLKNEKNALKLREDIKNGPFLEGKLLQCPTLAVIKSSTFYFS